MAWISIDESDVQSRLAGAELAAFKTRALAAGQTNPLPEIITQTIDEVRGYVAVRNSLEEGEKIPSKLKSATLALIVFRLITRLPLQVSQDRRDENDRAQDLLKEVAAGRFRVEEPETTSSESIASQRPSITEPERNFTRDDQDGI